MYKKSPPCFLLSFFKLYISIGDKNMDKNNTTTAGWHNTGECKWKGELSRELCLLLKTNI